MSWNAKRQLPRLLTLAGLALLLFTVQASAAPYKGQFTLNGPAQWGDVVLPAGTYQFSMPSAAFPYQVTVRGEGQSAIFFSTVSELPAEARTESDGAKLELANVNGTPVVQTLVIPKLGKAFHFAAPKEVKMLNEGASMGNGGCSGKL